MSLSNKLIIVNSTAVSGLLSYSVTPTSASGTSTTTLTHTVTGGAGTVFTFTSSGGGTLPSPTSATIPASGTYTDTSSQGAQGNNAGSRTLSFTVTNNADGTNTFTDTVAQSAGPVIQQARNVTGGASASGSGTQQGGSTFTYNLSTNYLPSNEYNLGACYVNINSWYDVFQSTGYQPPQNVPLSVSLSGSFSSWTLSGTAVRAYLTSGSGNKAGSITLTVGAQPNSNGYAIQVNGGLTVVAQSGWNAGSVSGGSATRSNPLN